MSRGTGLGGILADKEAQLRRRIGAHKAAIAKLEKAIAALEKARRDGV